jgi:hypothetical protein
MYEFWKTRSQYIWQFGRISALAYAETNRIWKSTSNCVEWRSQKFVGLNFSIENFSSNIMLLYQKTCFCKIQLCSVFLTYHYHKFSLMEKSVCILIAREILYNSIYRHLELHWFAKKNSKHNKDTLITTIIWTGFFVYFFQIIWIKEKVNAKRDVYSNSAWNSTSFDILYKREKVRAIA